MTKDSKISYSLKSLVLYFLKLGTVGFGGPVALVGYMHRDLVEERKWINEDDYKEGLALAQLAPGPLAAQLAIYIGFVHFRVLGATLAGLAFVIPSFCMVVALGFFYVRFQGLPGIQSIFYGVGAAVIGIIVVSSYKLSIKSVGKLTFASFKERWMLWCFYLTAAAATFITEREDLWIFLLAGFIYMIVKAPPKWPKQKHAAAIILGISFATTDWPVLGKLAWFFTKAGAFVFGSGLAIVPFLHGGVVKENQWLTEQQFLDAVAVAMTTPGPVVITVAFIGYLVASFPGACVAALATFLPCYLFTVIPAPYFKRIAKNASIKAFVDGITAAVVGALAGAVIVIAKRSIHDLPTALIALAALLSLIYMKKVSEIYLILAAALAGILIKSI